MHTVELQGKENKHTAPTEVELKADDVNLENYYVKSENKYLLSSCGFIRRVNIQRMACEAGLFCTYGGHGLTENLTFPMWKNLLNKLKVVCNSHIVITVA